MVQQGLEGGIVVTNDGTTQFTPYPIRFRKPETSYDQILARLDRIEEDLSFIKEHVGMLESVTIETEVQQTSTPRTNRVSEFLPYALIIPTLIAGYIIGRKRMK